jgi:Sigma-54 interaction domain
MDATQERPPVSCRRRLPNLLLIGPDTAMRPYLDRLMASPSVRACDSAAPHLPRETVQDLVVRDVERLTRDGQEQLVDWLNGPGFHTRIVATSGTSLYPMVERGEFSDALYYRINMMILRLDEPT